MSRFWNHFTFWPILSCELFSGFRRRWPSVLVTSSSLDLGSIGFPLGNNGQNLVAVFRSLDCWKCHSNWCGWWLVGDPLVSVFGGTDNIECDLEIVAEILVGSSVESWQSCRRLRNRWFDIHVGQLSVRSTLISLGIWLGVDVESTKWSWKGFIVILQIEQFPTKFYL
jgi:hypothetical protein